MRQLDIRINGYPLALACHFGDTEMSTAWPGGSEELSWSSSNMPARLTAAGALTEVYCGPHRVFSGTLTEPDPSQDRLIATGLYRLAEQWAALSPTGGTQRTPDLAISQAISPTLTGRQGLPWKRVVSLQSTAVDIDVTQGPVMLNVLLDTMASAKGTRWGVDPDGYVFDKADETTPTYTTLPLKGGLGLALDNYASTLIGRYFDSGTSTYTTVTVADPNPRSNLYAEQMVDLTPRGSITAAKATSILTSLFNLGLYRPQWTETLEFAYGEILTTGGVPVALETVAAGHVIRVYSDADLARTASGLLYADILIGATTLSDGTVKVQSQQKAARNFTDVLTEALKKK